MHTIRRVLVVTKMSAYQKYVRYKTARIRALLKRRDPVVSRIERADRHHQETLVEVREALREFGVHARFRDRGYVGSVDGFDLVMTVGGDGTLLSASHAVSDTPVFGINSAPLDSVGFLCSARHGNVRERVRDLVAGRLPVTKLARMRVAVDGKVVQTRVLNDVLFAHRNPAMTSKYILSFRGETEEQKSSGIWIGPAAGSTAAIHSAGGKVLPPRSKLIQFVVREPYCPHDDVYRWNNGLVKPGESLEVWNKMRDAALYVDGPRAVVDLDIGHRIRFDLSPESLHVVGFAPGGHTLR